MVATDGTQTAVLVWDGQTREQCTSDSVFFGKPVPAIAARPVQLDLRHLTPENGKAPRTFAAARPATAFHGAVAPARQAVPLPRITRRCSSSADRSASSHAASRRGVRCR
jgi:hypothetical protein